MSDEVIKAIKKLKPRSRSWKREVAFLALIFWMFVTYRVFWQIEPNVVKMYEDIYGAITWTIWLFVSAAFGAHYLTSKLATKEPKGEEK